MDTVLYSLKLFPSNMCKLGLQSSIMLRQAVMSQWNSAEKILCEVSCGICKLEITRNLTQLHENGRWTSWVDAVEGWSRLSRRSCLPCSHALNAAKKRYVSNYHRDQALPLSNAAHVDSNESSRPPRLVRLLTSIACSQTASMERTKCLSRNLNRNRNSRQALLE